MLTLKDYFYENASSTSASKIATKKYSYFLITNLRINSHTCLFILNVKLLGHRYIAIMWYIHVVGG